MNKSDSPRLRGFITTVTPDYRCGIITLDEPYEAYRYAIINDKTRGRIALMDDSGGRLITGKVVYVTKLRMGHDALFALQIEA